MDGIVAFDRVTRDALDLRPHERFGKLHHEPLEQAEIALQKRSVDVRIGEAPIDRGSRSTRACDDLRRRVEPRYAAAARSIGQDEDIGARSLEPMMHTEFMAGVRNHQGGLVATLGWRHWDDLEGL